MFFKVPVDKIVNYYIHVSVEVHKHDLSHFCSVVLFVGFYFVFIFFRFIVLFHCSFFSSFFPLLLYLFHFCAAK